MIDCKFLILLTVLNWETGTLVSPVTNIPTTNYVETFNNRRNYESIAERFITSVLTFETTNNMQFILRQPVGSTDHIIKLD